MNYLNDLDCYHIFDIKPIEETIGYTFQNKALLRQAFTRRSHTEENGGGNNELLEFIGDKVLDVTVVKLLTDTLGEITEAGEYCAKNGNNEGTYTKIKSNLVERKSLSAKMKQLDLARFLRMGRGDTLNRVQEQDKVQEDLFEAIIGAVTLDSGWDMALTAEVAKRMLGMELDTSVSTLEENPINLVQDLMQKSLGITPEYRITYNERTGKFVASLIVPRAAFDSYAEDNTLCAEFSGEGSSKSAARAAAAHEAWEYIRAFDGYESVALLRVKPRSSAAPREGAVYENSPYDESAYDMERAINQLQERAQKGYIEMPQYSFFMIGEAHCPFWYCTCTLPSKGLHVMRGNQSKKDAKKEAACAMLAALDD